MTDCLQEDATAIVSEDSLGNHICDDRRASQDGWNWIGLGAARAVHGGASCTEESVPRFVGPLHVANSRGARARFGHAVFDLVPACAAESGRWQVRREACAVL